MSPHTYYISATSWRSKEWLCGQDWRYPLNTNKMFSFFNSETFLGSVLQMSLPLWRLSFRLSFRKLQVEQAEPPNEMKWEVLAYDSYDPSSLVCIQKIMATDPKIAPERYSSHHGGPAPTACYKAVICSKGFQLILSKPGSPLQDHRHGHRLGSLPNQSIDRAASYPWKSLAKDIKSPEPKEPIDLLTFLSNLS